MIHLSHSDISNMDKVYRLNLINCISGFKSANLIGTKSASGQENLAVFSSVTHIGSNPAMLAFVTRPTVVPRHTYLNIKETGFYTINHITTSITAQAHQTSAKYDEDVSEFEACGLTAEYINHFPAPFVKECKVQLAMKFVEEYHIKANNTLLVIGSIEDIFLPDNAIAKDGWLDLNLLETATISGLNAYHKATEINRYAYARPNQEIKILD